MRGLRRRGGFQLFDFPDDANQGNGMLVLGSCEFVNAARQGFVGGQGFAKPDKGAHDEDLHLHGAITIEYRGQHGHAQLGKGQRRIFGVAAAALFWLFRNFDASCLKQVIPELFNLGQRWHLPQPFAIASPKSSHSDA
jgi:hypothetical protein